VSDTLITVLFDELMDASTAGFAGNYALTIAGSDPVVTIPVVSAVITAEGDGGSLALGGRLSPVVNYRIEVSNVEDLAGNAVLEDSVAYFYGPSAPGPVDNAIIGIWADTVRSTNNVESPVFTAIEGWIWCRPGDDGFVTAEFAVEISPSDLMVSTEYNPAASITTGDLTSGLQISFGDCQNDWQWLSHFEMMIIEDGPGYARIVDHPTESAVQISTCESGFPVKTAAASPMLSINGYMGDQPHLLSVEGIYYDVIYASFDMSLDPAISQISENYEVFETADQLNTFDVVSAELLPDGTTVKLILGTDMTAGTGYTVRVSNVANEAGIIQPGSEATFTFVEPAPPTIVGVVAVEQGFLEVTFSEPVDSVTAEVTGNYELFETLVPSNTIAITGALLLEGDTTVSLSFEEKLNHEISYTLRISNITDRSGESIEAGSITEFVFYDTHPPVLAYTCGPADGDTILTTSAMFCYAATDDLSPPDSILYSWRLDGGAESGWSHDTTALLVDLSEGGHLFEVKARDASGNASGFISTSFYVPLSWHDPLVDNTNSYFDWAENMLNWVAQDGGYITPAPSASWFAAIVSNRAFDSTESQFTVVRMLFTEDAVNFMCGFSLTPPESTDFFYNKIVHGLYIHSSGTMRYTWDTGTRIADSPTLGNGVYDIRVELHAADGTVRIAVEQVADVFDPVSSFADPLWSSSVERTIAGNHYIQVNPSNYARVYDVWSSNSIMEETNPPETQITSGPAEGSYIYTSSATIVWTGSDDETPTENLEYSFRLDGSAYSEYGLGTSHTYSALSDGSHTFEVRAKDMSGNVDPSPAALTFVVDTSSPDPTSPDVVLTGENPGDYFGEWISGAGDVNGDIYEDFLVGAPFSDEGAVDRGKAYLYLGGPGLDMRAPVEIADATLTSESYFGSRVAAAGDLNGDGLDDWMISVYGYDSMKGMVNIYFGGSNFDTDPDIQITGPTADAGFGCSIAPLGDVNMDGYDDIIIGSSYDDIAGIDAGRAYIYFGGPAMDTTPDLQLAGQAGSRFGFSVASAGDFNGDGFNDIMVGAPYVEHDGISKGWTYVFGGGDLLYSGTNWPFEGEALNDQFGVSVSSAGDFNGDGYDDILIGAHRNDAAGSDAGRAYVYYGGGAGGTSPDAILTGQAASDYFGSSVSPAGDLNGDGYDDLIIGAYSNDYNGADAGRVYVYYGGGQPNLVPDMVMDGVAGGDKLGLCAVSAGDIDGEGVREIIVSSSSHDSNTGYVHVFGYENYLLDNIWEVPLEAPTIQAAIDSAQAGDEIVVECGTWNESLVMKPGITLRSVSEDPACVIVSGPGSGTGILMSGCGDISVRGITVSGFGTGIDMNSSSAVFTDCVISDNGHGMDISDVAEGSSVEITDCVFSRNDLGGAVVVLDSPGDVTISGCTFEFNEAPLRGGALLASNAAYVNVSGCTFFANGVTPSGGDIETGSHICIGSGTYLLIQSSLLADGQGAAAIEPADLATGYSILLACCNIFGNEGGDWTGAIANQLGSNGNTSADPLFCGVGDPAGEYVIRDDSPCAAANSGGCGLVGAWDVGCYHDGTPPVVVITEGPASGSISSGVSFEFTWTASDNIAPLDSLDFAWRLDGGALSPWGQETSTIISDPPEGVRTFEAAARDIEGNIGMSSRVFIVDRTPPETQFTGGTQSGDCVASSSTSFSWTGTDNFSSTQSLDFSYRLDSAVFSAWQNTTSVTVSGLSAGSHVFIARARDQAGNVEVFPDTVMFSVGDADLEIVSIELPPETYSGGLMPVTYTLRNNGSCGISGLWHDRIYLSPDDAPGDDVMLGTFETSAAIPAASTAEIQVEVLVPHDAEGARWIVIVTDVDNEVVEEGFEENNMSIAGPVTVTVPLHPDLVVTGIVTPEEGWSGRGEYIEWTVTNQGDSAAAGGWKEYIYLSDDNVTGSDILLSEFTYDYPLGPGESYSHTHSIVFPEDSEGNRWIVVCTDGDQEVYEYGGEAGNCLVSSDTILVQLTPYPDLVVSSVDAPDTAWSNDEIEVSWSISNAGGVATSTPVWYDRIYLSESPGSASGIILGEYENLTYLAPGSAYARQNIPVFIPRTTASGIYYIVAAADIRGNVDEHLNEGNNIGASQQVVINYVEYPRPDLDVTSLIPPSTGWAGNPVTVSWTVLNTGNASTGGIAPVDWVMINSDSVADPHLATRLGGDFTGEPLDPDSWYTKTVQVDLAPDISGKWYLFVWTDVDIALDDSELENNLSDVYPIQISTPPPPDLAMSSVSAADDSVTAGDQVQIVWTVTNVGAGPTASPSWTDAVYLSEDGTLDTGADMRILRLFHQGYVDPDGEYTRSYNTLIPGNLDGTYYIFVVADVDSVIEEGGYEENNTMMYYVPLVVSPPVIVDPLMSDLQVTSLGVPASVNSGTSGSVTWTVRNMGPDETSSISWKDQVYLSEDSILSPASDLLAIQHSHYGGIVINETYSVTEDFEIPHGYEGRYFIIVKTDAANEVIEGLWDGNNLRFTPFDVELTPPPDLQVTTLIAPESIVPGEAITIQWKVTNEGTGSSVAGSWVDRMYLSPDSTLETGSDVYVAGFTHYGQLAAGNFYQESRLVQMPETEPGDWFLIATADASDDVYEHMQEDNNSAAIVVSLVAPEVTYPDLAMIDLQYIEGQYDSVSFVVANQSDNSILPSQRNWTDRFYLSQDDFLDAGTDDLVASRSRVGDLPGGQSYSATVKVDLPEGLEGSYYLIGATDRDGNVSETSEANNGMSILQVILIDPADLAVISLQCPDTLIAGQPAVISWVVENAGIGYCDPATWYDAVYLSLDRILDETDFSLGARYHGGGLAPAAQYPGNIEVTIPIGISGTHYVFVKTDKNDHVYEHDGEGNNIAYTAAGVEIVIPPANVDLVVSNVQVPGTGVSGDSISIDWTVGNLSENDVTGVWRDGIYISPDETWNISDIYMGEVSHTEGLQAGRSLDKMFKISTADYLGLMETAVPGLVPGGYRVVVRSDIKNNINESNEENNDGSSTLDMTIDLAQLIIGLPHADQIGYGRQQHFKVIIPSGHDLRFTADCAAPHDELDMFIRYDVVPDRINYDSKHKLTDHREIVIPGEGAASCYVMIYGDYVPGGGDYTLLVESYFFSLATVSPDVVDNSGLASLVITGGHLAEAETVILGQEGGDSIASWDVHVVNSTKVIAGFELDKFTPGTYDLALVTTGNDTTGLASAVTVIDGVGPVVQPDIFGPSAVRKDVYSDYRIILDNEGDADAHDVISGIKMSEGVEYQIVIDREETPLLLYTGEPILIYTSFIGVGEVTGFILRVHSTQDDIIEVTSIHTKPTVHQTLGGDYILSSWVDSAAVSFVDRLEYDGAQLDRELFIEEFTESWNDERQHGDGFTQLELLDTKIMDASLLSVASLNDPDIPAAVVGITALGLSSAETSVKIIYDMLSADAKFKKKTKPITVRIARDPNEKMGPTPAGEENFVSQLDRIPYTIYFENVPDASAAARQVVITDDLDDNFDPRSFRLGEIAWADTVLTIPTNLGYYHTLIMLESGYLLEIDAGIDYMSRVARWTFTTIDPLTGLPPLDPNGGFLLPNDETGIGEGHVFFSILAADDVPDGTEIANKALIVFDTNDPIETNEVVNVIRRSNPDLIVASIAGDSYFANYMEGEPIQLRATIANSGEADASGFSVVFFDGDPDGGGTMINAPVLIAILEGGEEIEIGTSWLPDGLIGERTVYVRADRDSEIVEIDEENNTASFIVVLEPKEYTITLDQGVNLVALPLEPSVPYSASSLAAFLGASQIIAYDAESEMFETFIPEHSSGDGFDILPGTGYIVQATDSRTVTFEGLTLPGQATMSSGMNFTSLPREPAEALHARDYCTLIDSDMLIRYLFSQSRFDAFIPDFHSGDGFEIIGACGYLAFCRSDTTVSFEGPGWAGIRDVPPGGLQAAPGEEGPIATHVLGLSGKVAVRIWNEQMPPGEGCSGVFRNRNTGVETMVRISGGTGEISGAFVDFSNTHPITSGDELEFVLKNGNGKPISDPVELTVGDGDIRRGYVVLDAVIESVTPSVTRLYQNYPNPFNPSTRVRYQLSSRGPVNMRVYNVAGQLVKTLVGSVQEAGYYEVKWDGRNNGGRVVSSGIYFCRIDTPGYEKSMKMVVIR